MGLIKNQVVGGTSCQTLSRAESASCSLPTPPSESSFSATPKLLAFIRSSECRWAGQSLNRGSSFLLREILLFIAGSDFRFTSLVLHYQHTHTTKTKRKLQPPNKNLLYFGVCDSFWKYLGWAGLFLNKPVKPVNKQTWYTRPWRNSLTSSWKCIFQALSLCPCELLED